MDPKNTKIQEFIKEFDFLDEREKSTDLAQRIILKSQELEQVQNNESKTGFQSEIINIFKEANIANPKLLILIVIALGILLGLMSQGPVLDFEYIKELFLLEGEVQ